MELVKDLEDFDVVLEELRGFLERDAVLELVGLVLGLIPFELHRESVSQWRTKSMA